MKGTLLIFDDFPFCRSRVIELDMTENRIFTLCRMITWVVFLRMFWNFTSSLPVKRGGSLSSSKQLIKFQNILRNTTQVIVWHRICLQTDGHGETSIPPYNFAAGGITIHRSQHFIVGRDNLSSVSQNVLKFHQQLTGEERRIPFIFGQNNQ
jgi:hypothetical protein